VGGRERGRGGQGGCSGRRIHHTLSGVYILENTPPPGEKYRLMSFGGKNMKRRREKRGKCKRKRKKEERKRKKEVRKRKKGERK
jgi:hypothetical protein